MANENKEKSRDSVVSIIDHQFDQRMKIAKFLLGKINDQRDVELAKKWLIRVSDIKSENPEVKKNRNVFLTYMIKVFSEGILPRCVDNQPNTICDPHRSLRFLHHLDDIPNNVINTTRRKDKKKIKTQVKFQSRWSDDYKTYVAFKTLPGHGVLVFMATSKYPGIENWDLPLSMKDSMKRCKEAASVVSQQCPGNNIPF